MSKHKRTIKAVTFDLWETLLLETDGANSRRLNARCKSLHRALDKFGVKISVARLESALKETILSLVHVWETNKDVAFPIDRSNGDECHRRTGDKELAFALAPSSSVFHFLPCLWKRAGTLTFIKSHALVNKSEM